jgi:hypothetical protein
MESLAAGLKALRFTWSLSKSFQFYDTFEKQFKLENGYNLNSFGVSKKLFLTGYDHRRFHPDQWVSLIQVDRRDS